MENRLRKLNTTIVLLWFHNAGITYGRLHSESDTGGWSIDRIEPEKSLRDQMLPESATIGGLCAYFETSAVERVDSWEKRDLTGTATHSFYDPDLKAWLDYIMDDAAKRSSGYGANGPSMEVGILRAHLMALRDHGRKVLYERKERT